ncbi:glycosyltransferase family 2 protein [Brevibacterium sp. CFH 10365]|uniref:glycosyltransferase family 2 protein n=1 Tax=Brevibacterium sp. CFH 10365 TaxID=2585207 RepID=UPI0012662273|nr:glycosyltransferase family 2 protein [Brevibacterium sp. CFH 10365]
MGRTERDRFMLTRGDLLSDYADRTRKQRGVVAACVMRHASTQYLDVLASQCAGVGIAWADLRDSLVRQMSGVNEWASPRDALAQAEIGRVLLLDSADKLDEELAVFMLEDAVARLPRGGGSKRFRLLLVHYYILHGQRAAAQRSMRRWKDIRTLEFGYLTGELYHPVRTGDPVEHELWLDHFNATLRAYDRAPVSLIDGNSALFDRLTADREEHSTTQDEATAPGDVVPLVSVVVAAYRPGRDELLTSIRSLVDQSVQSLEVIVVDDGSGSRWSGLFEDVHSLDPCVRVLQTPSNRGAYAARNLGFRSARGKYVTGQDHDDWSHPERLQAQIEYMEANPDESGCRVRGIACDSDLSRLRLGYPSIVRNASSLLMRTSDFLATGGFVEMRKAADTEFAERLGMLTGSPVIDLPDPLTIVRIAGNSLSRGEFRVGWSHPARRQVKSAYRHWHSSSRNVELPMSPDEEPAFSVPRRYRSRLGTDDGSFDVIVVDDLRGFSGSAVHKVAEIKELIDVGLSVAVLHMESPQWMTTTVHPLDADVQSLINAGTVSEVLYDDEVSASLLLIRDPTILQFMPDAESSVSADRVLVVADAPPADHEGRHIRYSVNDCNMNSVSKFNVHPIWVSRGPFVRDFLYKAVERHRIHPHDLLPSIDASEWVNAHSRRRRSVIPVVGSTVPRSGRIWPESRSALIATYPLDGSLDVRFRGKITEAMQLLDLPSAPPAWIVYPSEALPGADFLSSLDFYVHTGDPREPIDSLSEMLEAMASGVVVIAPPLYKRIFGDAVLYARAGEVSTVVFTYHQDSALYEAQRRKASAAVATRFSVRRFGQHMRAFVLDSLPEARGTHE